MRRRRPPNIGLTCDASLSWFVQQISSTNHDKPRRQVEPVVRILALKFINCFAPSLRRYSLHALLRILSDSSRRKRKTDRKNLSYSFFFPIFLLGRSLHRPLSTRHSAFFRAILPRPFYYHTNIRALLRVVLTYA